VDGSANDTERLSRIQTQWTTILKAQQGQAEDVQEFQRLLVRYYRAVYRYLLATVEDAEVAEELTQEFAVRFLRGDFRRADPQRGRFRDFLKAAVRNLAIDYWRRQGKAIEPLSQDPRGPSPDPSLGVGERDQAFLELWRDQLLARTWDALARVEPDYYAVLRLKTGKPEASSVELAEALARSCGRSLSVDAVRQLLHRARKRFAQLLVEEVATSIQSSDKQRLQDELSELGLLDYCRSALDDRDDTR
jgi:RNA polymerase sigma-70 factor (ECF subfamily)